MDLIAVIFDLQGEPVVTRTVDLMEVRATQLQILHLRLGLEISIITAEGRTDYHLPGAEQRLRQMGARP